MGRLTKWMRRREPDRPPPAAPPGRRVYAIGDIHGCHDLLIALHDAILVDAADAPDREPLVIHLGDYCDRGPGTKDVLDTLSGGPLGDLECLYLKGNHEAMMLDFLAGGNLAGRWLDLGGKATLASYGVPAPTVLQAPDALDRLRDGLTARLPPAHLGFLEQLSLKFVAGDYLFVHAGLRPKVPVAQQGEADFLWIREPFLSFTGAHEKVVVHGHSVSGQPEVRSNRICVDTGAYSSGVLTCVVLDGEDQRMLSVDRRALRA